MPDTVNRWRALCVCTFAGARRVPITSPYVAEEAFVFESVLGLPAHPLMVHAAVVLVPLFALSAIGYAVVPPLRARLRWVVVALAVGAPGAAFFAEESGEAFRARLVAKNMTSAEMLSELAGHEAYGNRMLQLSIALAVVALALAYLLSGSPERDRAFARLAVVQIVFAIVTVGLALVTLFYAYRTGDSGARIVWSGF